MSWGWRRVGRGVDPRSTSFSEEKKENKKKGGKGRLFGPGTVLWVREGTSPGSRSVLIGLLSVSEVSRGVGGGVVLEGSVPLLDRTPPPTFPCARLPPPVSPSPPRTSHPSDRSPPPDTHVTAPGETGGSSGPVVPRLRRVRLGVGWGSPPSSPLTSEEPAGALQERRTPPTVETEPVVRGSSVKDTGTGGGWGGGPSQDVGTRLSLLCDFRVSYLYLAVLYLRPGPSEGFPPCVTFRLTSNRDTPESTWGERDCPDPLPRRRRVS